MCHLIAFFRAVPEVCALIKIFLKKIRRCLFRRFFLETPTVDEDLVDLDLDETLAMTLHLLVLLFALELENKDLVAATLADDRGQNLGSIEIGLELAVFGADGEDVGKLEFAVLVGGGFNLQLLARGDEVLFAAGADDC